MQTKNTMEQQLSQRQEQILSLTEQKQAAEDRSARLETDLSKEREDLGKLMQSFEAKKEEHLREERKVKNLEITNTKQKEQLTNEKASFQELKGKHE